MFALLKSILPKLPWRWVGGAFAVVAAITAVLIWRHSLIERGREEGKAEQIALYEAAEAKATAEHNARIETINKDHADATTKLQGQLDAALARPATRTIRVRVPVSATCPAAGPAEASVPQPDPEGRLLEVDDPGYGRFQDWLTEFAGRTATGG